MIDQIETGAPTNPDPIRRAPHPALLEFDASFSDQPGLTYLFYAKEDKDTAVFSAKPDPITALGLIPAALGWREFQASESPDSIDRTNLAIAMQRHIREMLRSDRQFAVFWHIAGDRTVNFQSSSGYGFVSLDLELVDALVSDLADYLYAIA